jgi:proteasome lid subunit RPN8/RPN11
MTSSELLHLYEGDKERCGFILKTGEIVECENICEQPTEGFDFRGEDLVLYTPVAAASWHTHPGEDSNLSAGDFHSFINWPELEHYIIGNDGVTKYVVADGDVLVAD